MLSSGRQLRSDRRLSWRGSRRICIKASATVETELRTNVRVHYRRKDRRYSQVGPSWRSLTQGARPTSRSLLTTPAPWPRPQSLGLHVWGDAKTPTHWDHPLHPSGYVLGARNASRRAGACCGRCQRIPFPHVLLAA
jgi:hypothetical protein